MTIAQVYQYQRPKTVQDAVELLDQVGDKGRILAGGTDLIGWLTEDLVTPEILVDIKGIESLKTLALNGNTLTIGSGVTVAELMESAVIREHFPLFYEMAGVLACTGIRNRATVVGNISSAVPCCDNGPVLLVYGAVIHAESIAGTRDIPMSDWFVAPRKTALKTGEMVTGISVPLPKGNYAGCFVKQKRYKGEDLAQSSVAILALEDGSYRVSFGSVAPTPVRGPKIEALICCKPMTPELIAQACDLIPQETAPITDIRSTKEYRAHMLKVMFRRGMETVNSRINGNGPAYGVNVID